MSLMPVPESELPPPPPPRLSLAARLRNYLFAGILVTAPISITLYFTWSVVSWVDEGVARVLPDAYNPSTLFRISVPGLGLVMLIVALSVIGFLTANFLGHALIRFGERVLAKAPIVRSIYSSVKQIFETVFRDQSGAFREVVLIEYPRTGVWTLALVAGRTDGELRDRLPEDMLTVYVPTSPNPTSGYVLFVPRADAIRVDMSVEDCLKLILSGGLAAPKANGPTPVTPRR